MGDQGVGVGGEDRQRAGVGVTDGEGRVVMRAQVSEFVEDDGDEGSGQGGRRDGGGGGGGGGCVEWVAGVVEEEGGLGEVERIDRVRRGMVDEVEEVEEDMSRESEGEEWVDRE